MIKIKFSNAIIVNTSWRAPHIFRAEESPPKDASSLEEEEDYVPYVSVKERRKQKLVKLGRLTEVKEDLENALIDPSSSGNSSETNEEEILAKSKETSLLLQHSKLKKIAEAKQESEKDKRLKEEEMLLQSVKEHTALMGAAELAKGIQYLDPIKASWRPPRMIEEKPQEYHEK